MVNVVTDQSLTWKQLKKDYPVKRTPKDFVQSIINNKDSGVYFAYCFPVKYNLIRETKDTLIYSTEQLSRFGYSQGVNFYINKANFNQVVID